MSALAGTTSERALILAPQGRDANIAAGILREGGLVAIQLKSNLSCSIS
jgi:hypothetical protein